MATKDEVTQHLVDFLVRQQAFIGEQVIRAIRTTATIPSALALTDQQLIDHFPQLFLDLVEYFITEADTETRKRTVDAAVKHGATRWQQGYELTELVRELRLVQKSILDNAIDKFFELNPKWVDQSKAAWKNLAGFFEDCVAGSVQRYVENYTEELRLVNARLLEANKRLSKTDELRLRLMRTVSHEISNVLNTLNLTISFLSIRMISPTGKIWFAPVNGTCRRWPSCWTTSGITRSCFRAPTLHSWKISTCPPSAQTLNHRFLP
jgi:hypothetical protein